MASAYPSKGVDHPAARLAVRGLGMGALGPGGVANGAGQAPVGHEVGDGEVFQREPVVGLDELAGDLVEEISTDVGERACCRDSPRVALALLPERALAAGWGLRGLRLPVSRLTAYRVLRKGPA
jgi:hypothetical protein